MWFTVIRAQVTFHRYYWQEQRQFFSSWMMYLLFVIRSGVTPCFMDARVGVPKDSLPSPEWFQQAFEEKRNSLGWNAWNAWKESASSVKRRNGPALKRDSFLWIFAPCPKGTHTRLPFQCGQVPEEETAKTSRHGCIVIICNGDSHNVVCCVRPSYSSRRGFLRMATLVLECQGWYRVFIAKVCRRSTGGRSSRKFALDGVLRAGRSALLESRVPNRVRGGIVRTFVIHAGRVAMDDSIQLGRILIKWWKSNNTTILFQVFPINIFRWRSF